ncbi:hypothetical protein THASP1DRAFT_22231 [Thamnocephalis sphaerospora]|uniref:BZIP domain-containing protein n=1 Tax=Thamnocephalis sphaerospora TaxID=78915 RepID=A0A4P9XUS8_9FUNG|nr:hypothetical protein THASP1DRAFT_22231 [Thamnocephalis sphaerospora]|eukprot:RKP09993.1 hypothetical protein THASP1DRAFT_22231 [Thamnocephalis sphaerospora]
MSSSSLDARFISSPLAALSMVATSSLEGKDLYLMTMPGNAASAPASHAGSGPPSPSVGPAHMDDLNYHHRKRKCLAVDEAINGGGLPERTWSPKARSPLAHPGVVSASVHESSGLPPASSLPWPEAAGRDESPYPSPRLPAILPAPRSTHAAYASQPPATLAPILNPVGAGSPSPSPAPHPSLPPVTLTTTANVGRAPVANELYAPTATRRAVMGTHGPTEYARSSASPVPSSPGYDSMMGNESPLHAGSVDGGSRPATPTSTAHLTPDERRRRRLERNRLAARECRQKKKVYVQELEDRVERAESENRRLRKEVEELNAKLTLGSMHLDRRGMLAGNSCEDAAAEMDTRGEDASTAYAPPASPLAAMSLSSTAPTPPPSNSSFALPHVGSLVRDSSISPRREYHSSDAAQSLQSGSSWSSS